MSNQYALITGSSSGLGLEMTQYLLEEGYTVFGASRSGTDVDHPSFIDLELDVRDEESVIAMFDRINEDAFGLHLIVNNAGIFEMNSLVNTTTEEFTEHIETNLVGPFLILKHSYPYLIENQTHVVTLSSIAGKKGYPNISAYCASKFGLNGLIQSVQEEWKNLGIRFTNLAPGAVDTHLWDSISDDFSRNKMLDPNDFIHVFDMIVKSPNNMQFPELTFLHKSGFVE